VVVVASHFSHRIAMDVASLEKLRLLKVALDEGMLSVGEHAEQKRRLLDGLTPTPTSNVNVNVNVKAAKGKATPNAPSVMPPSRAEGIAPAPAPATAAAPAPGPATMAATTPPPPSSTRNKTTTLTTTTTTSGTGTKNQITLARLTMRVPKRGFGSLLMALTVLAVYVSTMFPGAAVRGAYSRVNAVDDPQRESTPGCNNP
jgi:hypothetical protein